MLTCHDLGYILFWPPTRLACFSCYFYHNLIVVFFNIKGQASTMGNNYWTTGTDYQGGGFGCPCHAESSKAPSPQSTWAGFRAKAKANAKMQKAPC